MRIQSGDLVIGLPILLLTAILRLGETHNSSPWEVCGVHAARVSPLKAPIHLEEKQKKKASP